MIALSMGLILVILFITVGAIFIYRFSNKIEIKIRIWFYQHEKLYNSIKAVKNFLYNILIKFFVLIIIVSVGMGIIEAASNFKTEHQKRIEFLEENCELIDMGYEVLNNGKSTYKCPNGKEYKE